MKNQATVLALLLILLLSTFWNTVFGQFDIPKGAKQYKYVHIVKLMNGNSVTGVIVKIDSQQIVFERQGRNSSAYNINQHGIKSIKIQRRGAAGRGFLLGAVAGGLLGGVVGKAAYEPPIPCNCSSDWSLIGAETRAIVGGAFGGILVGGIIGAIIGSQTSTKRFRISGDPVAFEKARVAFDEFQNQK